ncbi:MAG: SDR family oxidoreductase [Oligoflexales bacterium]|nr:SDR family oxidoreductase [Oligoflexales bacterium]
MDLNLNGKNALVCGSSQGIGKAVAKELASLGANVSLFARNEDSLTKVKNELDTAKGQKHHILLADFAKPEQVEAAIKSHLEQNQSIQILINNTGGPAPGPAHLADTEAYLAAFKLHLLSNQILVQSLLPGMKASSYGRIINIISTSVKQPLDGLGVSNTIRGAVANWAKTLANELGVFGVTVNNVLPGATQTARLQAILESKAKKQGKPLTQLVEEEKAKIPLRCFGDAEDLAAAVSFLASPAASYITGINLPVDGGRTSCL